MAKTSGNDSSIRLVEAGGEYFSTREVPLSSGGDGPYDSSMEARVAKLEFGMDELRATLVRLEPGLNKLANDAAEIKGKMATSADLSDARAELSEIKGRVNALPTTTQTVLLNAFTVVMVVGSLFALVKALHALP